MGVNDLKIALRTTRDELASFMVSVTGAICSLFGVLSSTQITEIENTNGVALKDDALFNKCINQAKNTAAIRERTYKDALVDDNKRKKTNHNGNSENIAHTHTAQGRTTSNQQRTAPPLANVQVVGNSRTNEFERGTNQNEANANDNNWLRILDENRKYNLILFRITDTNNKDADTLIVDGMMRLCPQNCTKN